MNPDKPNTILNVSGFPDRKNDPRVKQQDLLPAAVKQRLLGNIITGYPESLAPGSGVITAAYGLSDSTTGYFTNVLSDNFGRVILAVPDISIYIGSISATTQWPNASVGMGNMPIHIRNDWGKTNNVNVVTEIAVRNNTGSAQDVIVVLRWRIITNAVGGKVTGNV